MKLGNDIHQLGEQTDGADDLEQLRERTRHVFQELEAHSHSMMEAMEEGMTVQEEIQTSIRSLMQFPGHNPNPVLQITPEGVVHYANMAGKGLLESWSCSLKQSVPQNIKSLVSQVLESGERLVTEVQVGNRFLLLTIAPYADRKYVNIYGLDITDRRQTEVSLRESEEATRALLESAPIGIVIVNDHGVIDMINEKALRMFGYEQADLLGKPIGMLVPEVYTDIHAQQCMKYRSDPHVRPMGEGMDLNARRKDGSLFPVEINLGFIHTKKGLVTMSFIVDITQRQEIEAQKDHLMRMMVHDLRSPLSSMLTSLEFFRVISAEDLDGDQTKLLEIAVNSADKMLKLVNAILDVNRLKSGAMPVVLNVVDLPDIVNEVVNEVAMLAGEKQIDITLDIPPTLPPVEVDPSLITRVIQNLVNNAVKFTPEQGTIHLKAWLDQGAVDKLFMSVHDSGPGIPVEIKDRLFQEFVTGMQSGRGSGLGLAFCKLALKAHKQDIWVKTEIGEGTKFIFTLPLADEA